MRLDRPSEMQSYRRFSVIYKTMLIAFLSLCLLSGFLFANISKTGLIIDTDLRALLPETDDNALSQLAETRLLNRLGNTVILLVGATTADKAVQAANFGRDWLRRHTALRADSDSTLSHTPEQLIQKMKEHRFHLLTPEQRQLLENDHPEVLIKRGWSSILSPQSWVQITSTQEDPLALFADYVEWISQSSSTASMSQQGGYTLFSSAQKPGWFFAPLYIDTGTQTFQLEAQTSTVRALSQLQTELEQHFDDVQILKSGIIFHAAEAAQRAQGEMTVIGVGSLLGIILLFILAFRSLIPLAMSLASILFGCMIAFSIVHYLYSGLHIITLVFGAALIGVAVDYSLHYFTRRVSIDTTSPRFACLRSIFPAISLGLLTSVIGYGSLSQAPLPGLNQIALFSVTGLIGAWLFVIIVYPWLGYASPKPLPTYLVHWALFPQRCWQHLQGQHRNPALFLLGLGVLGAVGSSLTLSTSDDVRVLHTPSTALLEEDRELKTIINSYAGNQFFIVTGSTAEQLLENEEAFRHQLDQLIESKIISSYQSISRFLPSIARQQEDYHLQQTRLYPDSKGPVPRFMQELGFDPATVQQSLDNFASRKNEYLSPENSSELQTSGLDLLWLGQNNNKFASLILLQGISDTSALTMAAGRFDQIVFIDKIKELSQAMKQQRHSATVMLIFAYIGVIILLILRYRRINAMLLAMVPLVSTLLTITLLSSLGMPIGLFHLFAMFLILGLGMDYSIFIYESLITETSSYTAVLFSAITSCLSFGLLALSSTPMVQFFGTTILIGSLLNLILAPAVSHLSVPHNLQNKDIG